MKFMTDTQCAYIAGRDKSLPLGGVDCHVYFEFECKDIDEEKLAAVWKKLFEYHPEMRAGYKNGMMTDKEELPDCSNMVSRDISYLGNRDKKLVLDGLRSEISSRLLHTDQSETCGLIFVRTGDNDGILIFDWSLVVGDVKSFILILSELAELYCGGNVTSPSCTTDKLYELRKKAASDSQKKAEEVISAGIQSYAVGAALPTISSADVLSCCNYLSEDRYIESADRITHRDDVDALLMYAFTEALCSLTNDSGLLVNYPCFRRSADEYGCVGDFTDIKLIPVRYDRSLSSEENCLRARGTYREYMSFSGYKQTKIRRKISKLFPTQKNIAPVVFSPVCDVPLLSERFLRKIGGLRYMISQTPQVWLDVQTLILESRFFVSIVYPRELFDTSFVSSLADGYAERIRSMIDKGV